jgi:hypothetical protein
MSPNFPIALILALSQIKFVPATASISTRRYTDDRVVTWHFGTIFHHANKSAKFDLEFFAPTQPGVYPVIIFLTGLDGIAPSYVYSEFLTKLAIASNSIIVTFDRLAFISLPDKEEKLFEETLNWTLANIDGLIQVK